MSGTRLTGDNAPPKLYAASPDEISAFLDYACTALSQRRTAVIAALASCTAEIADDEQLGVMAENIRMAAALSRTAEERRIENKAPFLRAERQIDTWFKAWSEPLSSAMLPVQKKMDTYGAHKLAAERERARVAAAVARIEAERAAADAAAALRQGAPAAADAALDTAAAAATQQDLAEARLDARPAELTRSYGAYGAVSSVRQVWKWRVDDPALVPRAYLTINDEAIKQAAKARDASGRPSVVIPGITFYPVTKMGVR